MTKNEILNRLFGMYDSVRSGQILPTGLVDLIMDLAGELDRMDECRMRDQGEAIPDFVRK